METGEVIETIKVFNYAKYNKVFSEQLQRGFKLHKNGDTLLTIAKTRKGILRYHTMLHHKVTVICFQEELAMGIQPVYYEFEEEPIEAE